MKKIGLPAMYTTIVSSILSDRSTQLRFDDYTSSPIDIDNGSDQGNPLSVVLYNIYHSGLTQVPIHKYEDAAGYIDDAALYAEGPDFDTTNQRLKSMMERTEGALSWSHTHASPFETSKLAVMHFAPTAAKNAEVAPLIIFDKNRNEGDEKFTITRAENYKYLGVLINEHLSWKPHFGVVQSKAIKWTNLFCRLMRVSRGLTYAGAKRIYNAVAVPRITYACDVWYNPVQPSEEGKRSKGSVGITNALTSIQRRAAIAITGALRTTAGDVAEIHAGIPPIQHRLSRLCALAAARAATLPKSHPLHSIVKRKAAQSPVKRHRTTFQTLLHLNKIDPAKLEKISPTRRPPNFKSPHTSRIDSSKDDALEHDKKIENIGVRIYTDGSGYGGKIGASAVLYEDGVRKKTLKYLLGTEREHTVYEGEVIGALMGVHLASISGLAEDGDTPVSISLDNKSMITSLDNQRSRPSQTLLDWVHDAIEELDEDIAKNLELTWVPGHRDSRGNEAADEAAKEAAEGETSEKKMLPKELQKRGGIPVSLSALRQRLTKESSRAWTKSWKKSLRYRKFRKFEKKERGVKYEKLIGKLRRNQMAILTQLRTNHTPLNYYLHRIKKIDNADCPHCPGIVEDIDHYLFDCKNYLQTREKLRKRAGKGAVSIRYLFGTAQGVRHLLEYLHNSRRFERVMGTLWRKEDAKEEDDEEEGEDLGDEWEDEEEEEERGENGG